MQVTTVTSGTARQAPPWLWWTLAAGGALLLGWVWFVRGFLAEPSVVGRSRIALYALIAGSLMAAVAATAASASLVARRGWARGLAWIAATLLTVTVVGAIAGLPALIGLLASRTAPKN